MSMTSARVRWRGWEETGLTTEDGSLERGVSGRAWEVVSRVETSEARLIWWANGRGGSVASRQEPSKGMLTAFVRLGNASDEAIRRYAQEWGVLKLCRHYLPMTHPPMPEPIKRAGALPPGCVPLFHEDQGAFWEPLAMWRTYAQEVRSILNIAEQLHRGEVGKLEDWNLIRNWQSHMLMWGFALLGDDRVTVDNRLKALGRSERVGFERRVLSSIVRDNWIRPGGVELNFTWEAEEPAVEVGGVGLFGALATQLMLAVGKTDSLVLCTSCNTPFMPERRPRGPRSYCRACGRKDALRDAQRRRRARLRDVAADVAAPVDIGRQGRHR